MSKETKYASIGALITGILLGLLLYSKLVKDADPCPEVDTQALDSLTKQAQHYEILYEQTAALAAKYAAQRDSLYNNPTIIVRYKNRRNEITESLDAAGLHGVLDTLSRRAPEDWRAVR